MHTRTALAAALLAATGIGQVTIPPHSAIYNGFSRGFNFTAATNFIITQLNLPLDAFQAGDTASYLVRKNGAVTLHEVGNAGAIPTAIQVNTGDVIDVIGNWSPAAPGDFTAHNSYSSTAAPNTAPYATTIEGVAHTLNRTGWQWDIGVTPLTGVYLAPGAGQIGRVLMYTASSGLFAAFNATPRSGGSPLQVQFTDTSISTDPGGVQGWAWDFENDGIIDSLVQNPLHTYTTCGTYSVRLVVTDLANPASQVTRTNLITVDPLTASFSVAFLAAPSTYQFTDTSTFAPTSWSWDFNNDGIVDSTAQNPVYVAPSPCYATTVRLDVTNACRNATTTQYISLMDPTQVTTFVGTLAGGNGTSSTTWVGNHFDVVVTAAEGISVCGLQLTPYTFTGPFNVQVYVTDNTFVGKDTNAAAWRLAATGSGVSLGGVFTAPTPVDLVLNAPVYLPSGNTGMAIYIDNPAGTANLAYTNGPALAPYVGADVTLHPNGAGLGKTALFGAVNNSPRLWNGGFHYLKCSTSNEPGFGYYGPGCAGLLGIPGQDAQNEPKINSTFLVDVTNVPGGAGGIAFMALGLSRTVSIFGPLPFDGAVYGAPGCFLRASTDATTLLLGGPTTTWGLVIPNGTNLLCLQFYTQALVASTGTNPLGWVASDAYAGIIGQ